MTDHPASDTSPAWSPDGRFIAFFRASNDPAFLLVPSTGGPEKLVSRAYPDMVGRILHWLPSEDALVVSDKQTRSEPFSIQRVSISTGERSKITSPPVGYGDCNPAVSPDGRMLAFTRSHSFPTNELYLANIAGGEPRRLTFDNQVITGVTWSEDGESIVMSSERGGTAGAGGLWRVHMRGGSPEQLAGIGAIASLPTIARRGQVLVFQSSLADTNIWRIEPKAPAAKLIASSREDQGPQYSPDGQWISFESNRSGNWEVWVSRDDGSDARQITKMAGAPARYARWSPDGRWLAFDYRGDSNSDIYLVSPQGGSPIRVTNNPASDETPDWSKDGKWLYLSSDRSGSFEIWKTPAPTNPAAEPVQLTRDGGSWPTASPDGKWVYFIRGSWQKPELWRVAASGGGTPQFVIALAPGLRAAWTVDEAGVHFIDRSGPTGARIAYLRFSTGLTRTVCLLDKRVHSTRIAMSPDRKQFVYARSDGGGGDLMLVKNFR